MWKLLSEKLKLTTRIEKSEYFIKRDIVEIILYGFHRFDELVNEKGKHRKPF